MLKAILSVDLEDWDTSAYLREYVACGDICPKIIESTYPILELFEKKNIKATFFVLGIIAEKYPSLIRDIAQMGHEIASHGYSHTPLWNLTAESFKEELIKTNLIVGAIIGKKPLGFRAPYASLDASTAWAVDILKQEGFKYDSSIFPVATPLYGAPGAPFCGYRISSKNIYENDPASEIMEVPFTVCNFGLIEIPCTGGFYGRIIPLPILKYLFKVVNKDRPVNFYFHPWETFAGIPKIKAPAFSRFVSYFNIKNYLRKIEYLLDYIECISFREYTGIIMGTDLT
jgi:peptidoglycan-N-acetylglucosamine deacetylase